MPPAQPRTRDTDLLSREGECSHLASRVKAAAAGPLCLALDGDYGIGKTTLLRFVAEELAHDGHVVVTFDAWQEDYCGNALLALATKVEEALAEHGLLGAQAPWSDIRTVIFRLLRLGGAGAEAAGLTGAGAMGASAAELAQRPPGQPPPHEYRDTRASVKAVKTWLRKALMTIANSEALELPLVVIVDELDRCRPTYSLEVLETCKHFFARMGIAVIFGVNKRQLIGPTKRVYGEEFDAEGYLERFFDQVVRVSKGARAQFIDRKMAQCGISPWFEAQERSIPNLKPEDVRSLIRAVLGTHVTNLRVIEKTLHQLGSALHPLPTKDAPFAVLCAVLLLLRTVAPEAHDSFLAKEINDEEVVSSLDYLATPDLEPTTGGRSLWLATLMAVHASLGGGDPTRLENTLRKSAHGNPAHEVVPAAFAPLSESDLVAPDALRMREDLLHWLSWTPESIQPRTRLAAAVEYLETLELPDDLRTRLGA